MPTSGGQQADRNYCIKRFRIRLTSNGNCVKKIIIADKTKNTIKFLG